MSSATLDLDVTINGESIRRSGVAADQLLVDFLHEELNLTGTKFSCGVGSCGACKVGVREKSDGPVIPVLACYARMNSLQGMHITTVEGLAEGDKLHPLQEAFLQHHAFQCGFSTPGFLMAAWALMDELKRKPVHRSQLDRVILDAIGGNLCRCTGYVRYFEAIRHVIEETDGLVHDRVEESSAAEPAGLTFRIRKQSGNDLREKGVYGRFAEVTGEVRFDGFLDIRTCSASLSFDVTSIRTGERIRDLNLRKFLFIGATQFEFVLTSVRNVDRTLPLAEEGPGVAIPVVAEGTLGPKGQPRFPVAAELLLRLLPGERLRITSLAPVSFDLRDLELPVPAFALEFGLRLNPVVEVSLDLVLPYTIG